MTREKALRKSADPGREAARATRHAPARDRRRGVRGIRHARLRRDQARGRRRARAGKQGPALSLLQDQGRAVQGGDPQCHHPALRRHARADADDRTVERGLPQRSVPFLHSGIGRLPPRAALRGSLIAEGHKHPELTAFYYEQVIAKGRETLQAFIDRGIERGEFKPTPLRDFPQLLFAPALLSVVLAHVVRAPPPSRYRRAAQDAYRPRTRRDQGAGT